MRVGFPVLRRPRYSRDSKFPPFDRRSTGNEGECEECDRPYRLHPIDHIPHRTRWHMVWWLVSVKEDHSLFPKGDKQMIRLPLP